MPLTFALALLTLPPAAEIAVELRDGGHLEGRWEAPEVLRLQVRGGGVEVWPGAAAVIELTGRRGRATITLRNGDQLTGRLRHQAITLRTGRRRRVRVPLSRIAAIRWPGVERPARRREPPLDSTLPVVVEGDIFLHWPGIPTWHARANAQ